MELTGSRTILAPRDATWAALNDPASLKACIAGCESLERTDDNAYTAVVAMRVGPVSARFKGNLKMTDVDPPNGYTMAFDGQGGVAGFGKGSATVKLEPQGESTLLTYAAKASVGGKLAQIGSRLVDAAAAKVTDDFFAAFEELLASRQPVTASPSAKPVARTAPPLRAAQPVGALGWALAAIVLVVTLVAVLR